MGGEFDWGVIWKYREALWDGLGLDLRQEPVELADLVFHRRRPVLRPGDLRRHLAASRPTTSAGSAGHPAPQAGFFRR